MGAAMAVTRTVALAGNPNVGKSTLFNALTGLRQHTGNWPGKTVELARGKCKYGDTEFQLVDLPGTYSLRGSSEDEKIAGEFLTGGEADCTLVVCDGSCLERSLILALQIMELTSPVILCVNLMDEAHRRGIHVNGEKLSEFLGVPVLLTWAGDKKGLEKLLFLLSTTDASVPHSKWPDVIEAASQIAQACTSKASDLQEQRRQKIDKLLVSRRFGVPILLLLLLGIIWLTVWGANAPSRLLERLFDVGYLWLRRQFLGLPRWLTGLLLDGMYATSTRVLSVMLPPMAIFFPLFTILEDVGYLPRMAFLLDGKMCRCGGCGKQALTMCMGLGCNAVGVTGCRIIDSPRERLLAIVTNAMIPCNGRFPTLILLGSLFFPGPGAALAVAGCVVLGVLGAMGASGVLSKTRLKHEQSAFLMELPPFRRPRFGQILVRSLLDRTGQIALRALTVAAPSGAVLWLLGSTSLLGKIAGLLEPLGLFLGMNGVILLAFIFSLPANELLIPVILMVLTGAESLYGIGDGNSSLLLAAGWTWKTAVCTMVFSVFHWPCSTTLMTIHKETGSIKTTAAAFALPTLMGLLLCRMLFLIFRGL